jgi:hypothetical protein
VPASRERSGQGVVVRRSEARRVQQGDAHQDSLERA